MKERIPAALLAFFLGSLGVHKFYMGNAKAGIIYLLICWTGFSALFAFIESIVYFFDTDEKFQQRVAAKKIIL